MILCRIPDVYRVGYPLGPLFRISTFSVTFNVKYGCAPPNL
jgi:hypothetical protein